MKRALRTLAFLLIVLALLPVLAFGVVQTPPGRAMLARLVSSAASTPDLTVSVSGLGGLIPFEIRAERIELADAKGRFAGVENAALDWRPTALLVGRLDVTRLSAARVALHRRPELPPAPAATDGGTSFALPVRVSALEIPEIVLDEPVLGHAARLSLTGSADLASLAQGISAQFALARLDAPGRLAGSAIYAPESGRLDLDIAGEEPAGGLIARAAGFDGLPEIAATLKGGGPLDAWDGQLRLSVGTLAEASGAAGIRALADGRRVTFALDADMSRVLPADIAPIFAGRAEFSGSAAIDNARNVAIEKLTAHAAGFQAEASGTIESAGKLNLTFDVTANDAGRYAAVSQGVAWQGLRVSGTAGGTINQPAIDTQISASGVTGAGYGADTLNATLRTMPDSSGYLNLKVDGAASGLTAQDPQVASALGGSGRFALSGTADPQALPAPQAVTVQSVTVELAALEARFTGQADIAAIDGDLSVRRLDLAAFAPLAGQPLAGTATLEARLSAAADLSRASASVQGSAQGLTTGIARLDALLGPSLRIEGALARDGTNAVSVRDLQIDTQGLAATVNGRIASDVADLAAKATLDDLARLDPRLGGALEADATFSGTVDDLGVTARLRVPQGVAEGRPLRDLALDVTASDITGSPAGRFTLAGELAGKPARGTGALATQADGTRALSGLDIAIGSVTARGDVALAADGLANGRLSIAAGDLADVAALLLTEMSGRLEADVTLTAASGRQDAAIRATAANLDAFGRRLGAATIDGTVRDALGVPLLDGTADLRALDLSGLTVETASLRANGSATGTDLTLDAVAQGTTLRGGGRLEPRPDGARLRLDRLTATRGNLSVATSAPATFTLASGTVSVDRLVLSAGGGSATLSGSAGATLDLSADLRALPLALAGLAGSDPGLSGTLAGTTRIRGTPQAPTGTYDLRIARLSSPDLAASGAGPFDITATGALEGGRASLRAGITGPNLQGFTVNGSVPVGPGELDLALRGAINLAIVNPLLATTGARLTGTANVDATLRGTPAAPRAGGTVRVTGGRFDDAVNGVALDRIEAVLTGTDRTVTITSVSARTTNGGTVTGRGSITLDPAAAYPGRIDLDLSNAAMVNSDLMRLVAEGRIGIEGAFLNGPRLTGRLVLRALDINVPDRFPGGVQNLNVRHVNASGKFNKLSPSVNRPATASRSGIALDLVLSAPSNNVFVRGLGMEAQLGGEVKLSGTTRAPMALGGFDLRRGTFDFGGRRLTFSRGRVTFTGTTDPELDFLAETTSADITAQLLVSGPASRPRVSFSSTPTLPQDEVIARLLFGRSAGTLNAGQAVQLAQIAAQFSGGAGVLENLRRSLGVDSLDIGANSEGTGGQIGVGRRLNDNIYLGVRQGTTGGSSRVTVDVDVTKNIRLQGATGADGSAEVGIGAQWDY
ncbi:translocation/assembly module TamB domain-containing protein [Starkeya koreensis]|uniref:Translocation/assembly module TamB domain-containing protein n=1 Tax=Ancylobacter koreensis TaxID=266121 RepID=A0ABT0DNN2_9HYPH|nr:translocation/assembly module TamB domain-containing protein [Ancylobacter koreensis]MCK0208878.1 translocation/assembly module TamB domain-containing protein [Ancylobacter koreensis]